MKPFNYTYSHSLDEVIISSFRYKGRIYFWNDSDCVYYSYESEEFGSFTQVPKHAEPAF